MVQSRAIAWHQALARPLLSLLRIGFAIQKGLAAQLVARSPSTTMFFAMSAICEVAAARCMDSGNLEGNVAVECVGE
ncbi:hypothetical protein Tco_1489249 [Tanacetum coccineum]